MSTDIRRAQVDLILSARGTPRDDLFEYPHRADNSRRYIAEAETFLDKILDLQAPMIREREAAAWDAGAFDASMSLDHGGHNADNPYTEES